MPGQEANIKDQQEGEMTRSEPSPAAAPGVEGGVRCLVQGGQAETSRSAV